MSCTPTSTRSTLIALTQYSRVTEADGAFLLPHCFSGGLWVPSKKVWSVSLTGFLDHDFKKGCRVQRSGHGRDCPCMPLHSDICLSPSLCNSSSFHWVYHAQLKGDLFYTGSQLDVANVEKCQGHLGVTRDCPLPSQGFLEEQKA